MAADSSSSQTTLWWVDQQERIEKLEKDRLLLLRRIAALSETLDIVVHKVHKLETDG